MLWLLLLIGIPIVVFFGLRRYLAGNADYWPTRGVMRITSGEIGPFLQRIRFKIPMFKQDQIMYNKFRSAGERYGGYMEFRRPLFFVADAELAKQILVKDFDHFVNRRSFTMDEIFNEMLTSKKNQEWKNMRATLSPTFTTGKIRRMYEVFNGSGKKLCDFIGKEVGDADSGTINLQDSCCKFTMDVIASAAFGLDVQTFQSESYFFKMARRFQSTFTGIGGTIRLLGFMVAPKLLLKLGVSLTDKKATTFFIDTIKDTKKHRDETGVKRDDFFQLLLETQTGQLEEEPQEVLETFEKDAQMTDVIKKGVLTDKQLVSQALLFFVAGFDTTETLLIFACYELAVNPDVQDRLAKEVKKAADLNNGELTYDAINKLEYLEMVVSETLRHYPPGFRLERESSKDYKVPSSDLIIPKGTTVTIPAYAFHHDPEHFPNPDKFDPENFTAENKASRHPYAYLPFGAGPRNCIAMRFALMEGKTAVAHLVHNFVLEPSAKTPIPMKFAEQAGMKPDGGMWLNVKRRYVAKR